MGDFVLALEDGRGGTFVSVAHASEPGWDLWSSDPGEKTVEVYLPAGRWVHLWSGRRYGSREGGTRPTVDAPIGKPAVFFREGSEAGEALRRELEEGQLL